MADNRQAQLIFVDFHCKYGFQENRGDWHEYTVVVAAANDVYCRKNNQINLYCSRQRTIMYSAEVQNGLYDTKRDRRKMGRDTS